MRSTSKDLLVILQISISSSHVPFFGRKLSRLLSLFINVFLCWWRTRIDCPWISNRAKRDAYPSSGLRESKFPARSIHQVARKHRLPKLKREYSFRFYASNSWTPWVCIRLTHYHNDLQNPWHLCLKGVTWSQFRWLATFGSAEPRARHNFSAYRTRI